MASNQHVSHPDRSIAYHVEWGFRREALRWNGTFPCGPNIHPIATEFRSWMNRSGTFTIFSDADRSLPSAYTNPYTYSASVLATVLSHAMNDAHAISTSDADITVVEAEIKRVRNYNEQVLHVARLSEALTKQLLYCTAISGKHYERASLGQLLNTECQGCKASQSKRHRLSLLGSLAHRYFLCQEFEHCMEEYLRIVGRKRNVEAAHSETAGISEVDVGASRERLSADTLALGNEFLHLLEHLSEIETRMIKELEDASEVEDQRALDAIRSLAQQPSEVDDETRSAQPGQDRAPSADGG